MRLDKLMIALLIFAVVVLAGTNMIADVNNQYDDVNMSTDEFSDTFTSIETNYNISKEATSDVETSEIDDDDALDTAIKGAVSASRLVGSTKSTFKNIINDIANVLGVETYLINAAIIAITIFIAWALVYLFMRFKP